MKYTILYLKKIFSGKTIKVLLTLILIVSPITSFSAHATENTEVEYSSDYKTKLTTKINNIRQNQNLNQLATSSKLMLAAQLKAEDMAKKGYFAHTSPEGISPWHWFYEVGYQPKFAGENLALSYSLESDIVKHWLNSPSHQRNIVNSNYTETGIGVAEGMYKGHKAYYIVELFGKN